MYEVEKRYCLVWVCIFFLEPFFTWILWWWTFEMWFSRLWMTCTTRCEVPWRTETKYFARSWESTPSLTYWQSVMKQSLIIGLGFLNWNIFCPSSCPVKSYQLKMAKNGGYFKFSKTLLHIQRLMTSDILLHNCGQMYEPMRSRHLKNTFLFSPRVLTLILDFSFILSLLYLAIKRKLELSRLLMYYFYVKFQHLVYFHSASLNFLCFELICVYVFTTTNHAIFVNIWISKYILKTI